MNGTACDATLSNLIPYCQVRVSFMVGSLPKSIRNWRRFTRRTICALILKKQKNLKGQDAYLDSLLPPRKFLSKTAEVELSECSFLRREKNVPSAIPLKSTNRKASQQLR